MEFGMYIEAIMTWHDLRIVAFNCSFPTYMYRSQKCRVMSNFIRRYTYFCNDIPSLYTVYLTRMVLRTIMQLCCQMGKYYKGPNVFNYTDHYKYTIPSREYLVTLQCHVYHRQKRNYNPHAHLQWKHISDKSSGLFIGYEDMATPISTSETVW